MSSDPFVTVVNRTVEEIRADYPGLSHDGHAFAVWAAHFLHGLSLDEAVEACATSGSGSGDGGVDSVVIDDSDGVVYVLQCKYSADGSKQYDVEPLGELATGLSRLLSPIYSEAIGGEFASKAKSVRAALAGDADLVLQVVVFGSASPALSSGVAAWPDGQTAPVADCELWDITRLDREWTDQVTVRDLKNTKVAFQTVGGQLSVPGVAVEGLTSYGVVVLDGRALGEAAREFGARLVDMNVRYHLDRTKINDSIARTAVNPDLQAQFLVLNNGLTVVCEGVVSHQDGLLVLDNPQIVNGAQTALTIANNIEKIPSGAIQVLARVVEVDKTLEVGVDLARSISEATNRQNPVSSADLKAHDPLQVRIERDLQALSPPWFYERRRNSYAALSDAKQKSFAGVITKEELGQRYRAMTGEPARSITAKGSIFDLTTLYGTLFDRAIPVEDYLLAHQLWNFYHQLLTKSKVASREALYTDFDEETRQLLMRARNQFAAHATALAYFLLQRHYQGRLTAERELAVALDAKSGGGDYVALHRLVVMTLIKWAVSSQQTVEGQPPPPHIRDAFEEPQTFVVLKEDAKMVSQFFKQQTLDLLPE